MPARNSSMELSSPSNGSASASVQPSRRKSGRVSHKPEVLKSGFTSRTRAASTEVDQDVDMDEVSSVEDEDTDGEPDEQELLEQRRRSRKRPSNGRSSAPAKKSKTAGASTSLAIRPAPQKAKKVKRPATVAADDAEQGEVGTLYRGVFLDGDNDEQVVQAWHARFHEDEALSLAEIVNFFLECAGCYIKVDQHDIDDVDNCTSKLKDIQGEFQATKVSDYPLIKQRTGPSFRRSLSGFISAFVQELAETGTLTKSPELLENVQAWLMPMSSAASRPIRHTATVIALDFTSAFSVLGRAYVDRQAKLNRQAEGEEKNKKVNKARVEGLRKEAGDMPARIKQVKDFIQDWFDTVFVHRYRDVDPRIRADCIRSLGEWTVTFPEHFLDGAHLRYLGWLISDTSPPTRQEAIKQLQKLYKDDSKLAALRQFTERFRARMVEIASQDAELNARIQGIDLLDILREKGFLEPDDIDQLGKLIYDVEPRVRKAIVPFFAASVVETYQLKIDELGEEGLEEILPEEHNEEDFESPQRSWLKFKALAELMEAYDPGKSTDKVLERQSATLDLLKASGHESRFSSIAKALSGSLDFLEDWRIAAGYLLHDHSSASEDAGLPGQVSAQYKLNESEEVALLHVLNTCVRNELAAVVDDSATAKKGKKSKKEQEELQQRRDAATQHLATVMPKLLAKYSSNADTTSAVLQLARTLNLEVFHQLRQDSTTYAKLLDDINKQFTNHEDRHVLDEATAAMLYSKGFEDLEEVTETKLASLWDDTAHKFVVFCKGEDVEVRGSIQDDMLSALSNATLRLSKLASISDPAECLNKARTGASTLNKPRKRQSNQSPTYVPLTLLLQLLGRASPKSGLSRQSNSIEDELVTHCIQTLFFYFLWQAQATYKSDRDVNEQETIQERRTEFAGQLRKIINARRGADSLRLAATRILLDLETMYVSSADAKRSKQASKQTLSVKDQSLVLQVFVAAERAHALKSGLHRDSPASDDEPSESPESGSDLSELDDPDRSPVSSDDEGEEAAQGQPNKAAQRLAQKKQRAALLAEEAFCDLSGRIALALIAGSLSSSKTLDRSQDRAERRPDVQKRFLRNRNRLGKNFKMLVAQFESAMAEKEGKATRSGKTRADAAVPNHNSPNAKQQTATQIGNKTANHAAAEEDDESSNEESVRSGDEQADEEAAQDGITDAGELEV